MKSQKFGEGKNCYIVETKENLDKGRRPEAGYYLDYLLNENITLEGPGENVSIVKSVTSSNGEEINSDIANNFDVIGHAITGGGKTAAFLIPVINYIAEQKSRDGSGKNLYPYCIVISPTKELAEQLYEDALTFSTDLDCIALLSFGEIPRQNNIARVKDGCDIFICTVGRLCDYLQQKVLDLRHLRFLIFDEADRLLQVEGFLVNLVECLLPRCREIPNLRKMMFSATDCDDLADLKEKFSMPNATKIVVGILNSVNPFIEQQVLNVKVHEKREILLRLMQALYLNDDDKSPPKTIVFVNTKRFATVIACYLSLKGYKAYPIHGNLTAKLRREAIVALQDGECHILVSTDVAARGLDIKGVSHIINYEMPKAEDFLSYIHRVGRTGRVGNVGCATTFFDSSVDYSMAFVLYRWLEMNKQEIPDFLIEEARRQRDIEDLQRKTREEL
uniref:RNA helicase n=1 Tax=Setaria digitata TaxID=48799 RepID=A0A915PT68_9BILA